MIRPLDWDSGFFNLCVAELKFDGDSVSFGLEDYDLLYVVSDAEHELKLEGFENSFSEEKLKFEKAVSADAMRSPYIHCSRDIDFSIDAVYDLAFESGKHSRFFMDRRFGQDKFKALYRKWVDNSLSHDFAADVLLFVAANVPVGLLTYSVKGDTAFVGLLAVGPEHQGKGIGSQLLGHLESILNREQIKSLVIPTQRENEAACRFYAKAGYEISERQFIKHYWKINDPI